MQNADLTLNYIEIQKYGEAQKYFEVHEATYSQMAQKEQTDCSLSSSVDFLL